MACLLRHRFEGKVGGESHPFLLGKMKKIEEVDSWIDKETGYPCIVMVNNTMAKARGILYENDSKEIRDMYAPFHNGYVGVPKTNELYKIQYLSLIHI